MYLLIKFMPNLARMSESQILNYSEIIYKPLNENIVGITTRRNPTKQTFKFLSNDYIEPQNKNSKLSNLVIPNCLLILVPKQIRIQTKKKASTLQTIQNK